MTLQINLFFNLSSRRRSSFRSVHKTSKTVYQHLVSSQYLRAGKKKSQRKSKWRQQSKKREHRQLGPRALTRAIPENFRGEIISGEAIFICQSETPWILDWEIKRANKSPTTATNRCSMRCARCTGCLHTPGDKNSPLFVKRSAASNHRFKYEGWSQSNFTGSGTLGLLLLRFLFSPRRVDYDNQTLKQFKILRLQ